VGLGYEASLWLSYPIISLAVRLDQMKNQRGFPAKQKPCSLSNGRQELQSLFPNCSLWKGDRAPSRHQQVSRASGKFHACISKGLLPWEPGALSANASNLHCSLCSQQIKTPGNCQEYIPAKELTEAS